MKHKKTLSLIAIALSMAITITACGNKSDKPVSQPADTPAVSKADEVQTPEQDEPETAEPAGGTETSEPEADTSEDTQETASAEEVPWTDEDVIELFRRAAVPYEDSEYGVGQYVTIVGNKADADYANANAHITRSRIAGPLHRSDIIRIIGEPCGYYTRNPESYEDQDVFLYDGHYFNVKYHPIGDHIDSLTILHYSNEPDGPDKPDSIGNAGDNYQYVEGAYDLDYEPHI